VSLEKNVSGRLRTRVDRLLLTSRDVIRIKCVKTSTNSQDESQDTSKNHMMPEQD